MSPYHPNSQAPLVPFPMLWARLDNSISTSNPYPSLGQTKRCSWTSTHTGANWNTPLHTLRCERSSRLSVLSGGPLRRSSPFLIWYASHDKRGFGNLMFPLWFTFFLRWFFLWFTFFLRWFFCLLGCRSFHFVSCIPPFWSALVFKKIDTVSSSLRGLNNLHLVKAQCSLVG